MVHYGHALGGQNGDITVGKEENLARMFEQGRDVAGDEIFTIAESNDRRRAHARRDNFLGVLRREEHQRVDAAQFLQRAAHGFLERHAVL